MRFQPQKLQKGKPPGKNELPPISWTSEIGGPFMSGNARYDVSMRLHAVELYEQG